MTVRFRQMPLKILMVGVLAFALSSAGCVGFNKDPEGVSYSGGAASISLASGTTNYDFGLMSDSQSGNHAYTITNDGGEFGEVSFSMEDGTYFDVVVSGCDGTVPTGGSCSVTVTYNPGPPYGTQTDTLEMTYTDSTGTHTVEIGVVQGESTDNVKPVVSGMDPTDIDDFDVDTEHVIELEYSDGDGDPATDCTVTNLANLTEETACSCTAGVCTVGLQGAPAYSGSASFDYTVTTNGMQSDPGSATLNINNDNAPVANPLDNTDIEDFDYTEVRTITLDYTDADGDNATSCTASNPSGVTLSGACSCSAGVCSVEVTAGSSTVSASFNYAVKSQNKTSNTTSATFDVNNDARPQSNAMDSTDIEDFDYSETRIITLDYTDSDGDNATSCATSNESSITVITPCACAAGTCTVEVQSGVGDASASFDFTVTSLNKTSSPSTATFNINGDARPSTTDMDSTDIDDLDYTAVRTITLNYSDSDGDSATSCSASNPANITISGACSCTAGVCTVEVTAGSSNVVASFDFSVKSLNKTSNTSTATFNVNNDARPVANDLDSTDIDDLDYTEIRTITLDYTDADGDNATLCSTYNVSDVSISSACSCAGGVCTVEVTSGSTDVAASFDYTVTSQNKTSNIGSVTFNVNNDTAPVANALDSTDVGDLDYTEIRTITLDYTDADGDNATSCTASNASNISISGACSCAGGVCTAEVTAGSSDVTASFDYTVKSQNKTSNTATATFNVNNDGRPIAQDMDSTNIEDFDHSEVRRIWVDYADPDGDKATECTTFNLSAGFTVSDPCSCDGSGYCSLEITAGTGNVAASFDYTVKALNKISNTGTVSFNINDNQAPVGDTLTSTEIPDFDPDTQQMITLTYTDNEGDSATDCHLVTVNNVTETTACACTGGVCTVGVTGTAAYEGAADFTYKITAGNKTSSSASANFNISGLSYTPIANISSGHATEGSYPGTANDADGTNYNPCTSSTAACYASISHHGNSLAKQYKSDYGSSNRGAWYLDDPNDKVIFAKGVNNHTDMGYFPDATGLVHEFYRIRKVQFDIEMTVGVIDKHSACGLAWGMGEDSGITPHPGAPGMPLNLRAGGRDLSGEAECVGAGWVNDDCGTAGMDYWRTSWMPVSDDSGATNDPNMKIDMAFNFFADEVEDDALGHAHWNKHSFMGSYFTHTNSSETTFGETSGDTATATFEVVHDPNERTLTFTVTPTSTSPISHFNSGWVADTVVMHYDNTLSDKEGGQNRFGLDLSEIPGVSTWEDFQAEKIMLGFFSVGFHNRCEISNMTVDIDRNTAAAARDFSPPDLTQDTESSITLDYYDHEGDPATECSVTALTNVFEATGCACSGGTCTVGIQGTGGYTGAASFDYTVTTNNEVSNTGTATFNIN